MNSATRELLEQHFVTAFAAPDGIKKLRELILTLAMQGKLVPQDASDPPASQLLKEISAEKKRLVKEGKMKAPKPLPEIKPEAVPYLLPQGWEWVRLGEICDYNGRANIEPEFVAANTWLLDLEDIEKNTSRLLYRAKYSERQSKSTKSTFQKGDVLYGKLRPYLDKVLVADADGVCTTEIVPIVPSTSINSEFLRWLLKRPAFLEHVNSLMYGVKMPRLGTEDAVQSIHPLPPLPEQHRIVAKIDQLMARCDELERLRGERDQKRRSVHTAALKQLLDAQAADSIADAWQFISQHFGDLYAVKENVAELRKAVLQLAVMGKLVPQNPNDPPASQLLREIEAEKKRLVKEGKIRVPKPLPEITAEEMPYALPQGWEWVRIGEVCSYIQRGKSPVYADSSSHRVISQKCVRWNGLDLEPARFIEANSLSKYEPIRFLKGGDLLWNSTGTGTIGRACLVSNELDRAELVADSHVTVVRALLLNPTFLWRWIQSPIVQNEIESVASGTTNQIELNTSTVINHLMPLPPLEEQHRIVAKIDQLMSLCDILEKQIDATTGKQTELLDALMAPV